MAVMWQLPTREVGGDGGTVGLFPARWPVELVPGEALLDLRHTITRHRIRARLLRATAGESGPALRWVERGALAGLALTGMTRKALAALAGCGDSPPELERDGGPSRR